MQKICYIRSSHQSLSKAENFRKPKAKINNVEDVHSEAATVGTSISDEQVNQLDNMLGKHNINDANYYSDYDDLEDNCVAVILHDHKFREVQSVNVNVHLVIIETEALFDTCSVCMNNHLSLTNAVVMDKNIG